MIKTLFILLVLLFCNNAHKDRLGESFSDFQISFIKEYKKLNIPDIQYDYKAYFNEIPDIENLNKQRTFFEKAGTKLKEFQRARLNLDEQIIYNQLAYEIEFNFQRVTLETNWVKDGRKIPEGGLHGLNDRKSWCSFFIKRYTSLSLSPEQIMEMGKNEVEKVQREIRKIQQLSGYKDSTSFYKFLQSESFYITDKNKLLRAFEVTDSIIRSKLPIFIEDVNIPEVHAMEWANSGPNTPPGIYMNHSFNPYGKDVFQYNFYGGKFNRRAIDWLFMHEAIPGHHLQFSIREGARFNDLQELFSYSGNFEGWGCYVEYAGKQLGVYRDIYSYLGKWEWDLVRSVRLVLDEGIHYYGWSEKEAMAYWKQNITGQDEIAEREITRVTNWPAQALSYKVGADCITQLKSQLKEKYGTKFDESRFHHAYLSFGMCPLEVIKKDFESRYEKLNSIPK